VIVGNKQPEQPKQPESAFSANGANGLDSGGLSGHCSTNDQQQPEQPDLDIPPFLDRRPQPRQDGRWVGTYVSDDDDAFIESGEFK
jgi:hypothetical protein